MNLDQERELFDLINDAAELLRRIPQRDNLKWGDERDQWLKRRTALGLKIVEPK